ncbi:hypothetical protein [Saccharopolyspora sp. CA-218241]|uniref:hypothetical protein n=1 Tax=Saccharopolyspora sp. CA-218241 TaxID=3240027 RepID=UPI003D9779BE
MKLTFEGTTSHTGTCPTFYSTDRGTYVLQGTKVTDPEALAALREYETAVEIPVELLNFAPEAAR